MRNSIYCMSTFLFSMFIAFTALHISFCLPSLSPVMCILHKICLLRTWEVVLVFSCLNAEL